MMALKQKGFCVESGHTAELAQAIEPEIQTLEWYHIGFYI